MSYENDLVYVTGSGRRIDVRPVTRSVALEVVAAAEAAGHELTRIIGATTWADHDNLLCIDFVCDVPAQVWIREYLIRNETRVGVWLIINQRRIYRTYPKTEHGIKYPADSWAPYDGTDNPHTDHVHLQVIDRPYSAPPKAVTVRLTNLRPGKTNADVTDFQRALLAAGCSIPAGATGFYGDQTTAACKAFQRAQNWVGEAANGIPGPLTIERLGLTLTK